MDYKIEYFPFAATKEELYKKGPIVTKLEEYIRAAAQSPFLTKRRKDPFKEDEDQ